MSWLIRLDADACRGGVACLAQTWLTSRALWVTNTEVDARISDEALIAGALRGEPGAIQSIYERHAAAVYRRLTHLLGPDPEREDLLQEVFVDLFRQLGSYRAAASLRTYLLRIVSNKVCDHLRHRQRHRRAVAESPRVFAVGAQAMDELRSSAPSPEDRVSHAQELALVHQALDRLTPKKRVAFLLRVVEDLSLKEIAAQVGASVFTVAQRLRHANRELQRFLDRARRTEP